MCVLLKAGPLAADGRLPFLTYGGDNMVSVSAFCSVTCKSLCVSCLTEIRVMVFVTLKMPKSLINNEMRVARPGGSEPPPSLGVRLRLAQKEDEGAFSRSVRVRATKRRRRIFSLWRSHVSDRGERSHEARARTERGGRGSLLPF